MVGGLVASFLCFHIFQRGRYTTNQHWYSWIVVKNAPWQPMKHRPWKWADGHCTCGTLVLVHCSMQWWMEGAWGSGSELWVFIFPVKWGASGLWLAIVAGQSISTFWYPRMILYGTAWVSVFPFMIFMGYSIHIPFVNILQIFYGEPFGAT